MPGGVNVTLQEQWINVITEYDGKSRGRKVEMTKSRLFLCVLASRLGKKFVADQQRNLTYAERDVVENMAALSQHLPIPAIQEVETLYQEFMDESVRSSTGSYYTSEDLVNMMVRESLRTHYRHNVSPTAQPYFPLDHLLTDLAQSEPSQILQNVLDEQVKWYESLHILDLSCGSGAFLRQALIVLFEAAQRVYNSGGQGRKVPEILFEAVEKKITGIEFQAETCMLAELLMHMLMTELMGEAQDHLQSEVKLNIICVNALNWNNQGLQPNNSEGYPVILGNPPYLGEKGNTEVFDQARATSWGQHRYEKNMDFFYYFIHKGLDLLAVDGVLCYVTTNYFSTADGARKLRARLREEAVLHWIINPERVTLFPHAKGQHNLIFCLGPCEEGYRPAPSLLWHNTQPLSVAAFCQQAEGIGSSSMKSGEGVTFFSDPSHFFDQRGQLLVRSPGSLKNILDKLVKTAFCQLQDLCTVNQGVVSGADKMTQKHEKTLGFPSKDQGIFVLSTEEKQRLVREDQRLETFLQPFYKNSQISPYSVPEKSDKWLFYITDDQVPDLGWSKVLADHLTPFKPLLEQRREVQMGVRQWYALHWPRKQSLFEKEKILAPQRARMNIFGYTNQPWYASADVYFIKRKETCVYTWAYLLLWLNSALCYGWLSYYGKMKGRDLELYATPLKQIPVLEPPTHDEETWMLEKYEEIRLNLTNAPRLIELQRQVDQRFLQWLGAKDEDAWELLNQVETLRIKPIRR